MSSHRSRKVALSVILLALALAASVGAAILQKDSAPLPGPATGFPPPALADRDGNGLSDDLQAKLADAQPGDRFKVIVTFSGPGNAATARAAVGAFVVYREFQIIRGFAATMTAAQAEALARVSGVFRVEEDFEVTTQLDAANRDFGAWLARFDNSVTGFGVGICVIDTGVDPTHVSLDDGKVVAFKDFVNRKRRAYDDHGHGTHVASIAAGDGTGSFEAEQYKGVAPGADVYAVKVLNSAGSGTASAIIKGIEWCTKQSGVHIISLSLGTAGGSDGQDSLSKAVNSAVDKGTVVVVAAGNSGDGPESVGSPGAAAKAITVGAVAEWSAATGEPNHSDGVYLAPFSSRGPTLDGRTKPDITAPGVSITAAEANTVYGFVPFSGTSMATPYVAGAVALAIEAHGLGTPPTPAEVKNWLKSTAQDRGPTGEDNEWGAGLVDVYAVVATAAGASNTPTAFPTYERI